MMVDEWVPQLESQADSSVDALDCILHDNIVGCPVLFMGIWLTISVMWSVIIMTLIAEQRTFFKLSQQLICITWYTSSYTKGNW